MVLWQAQPMLTVRGLSRQEMSALSAVANACGFPSRQAYLLALCRGQLADQTRANQVVSEPVSTVDLVSDAQPSTAASTP
jgi:hypothetical protein